MDISRFLEVRKCWFEIQFLGGNFIRGSIRNNWNFLPDLVEAPPRSFETNFSIEFYSISNEGDFVFSFGGIPLRNLEERIKHRRKKKHVGSHDPQPDFHIRPGCFLCVEKLSRKVSPPLHYLLPSPLSFQPFLKNAAPTTAQDFFKFWVSHTGRSLWSSLFHKQFVVTMVTHD
jgi:hypothetical protein